MARKDTYRPVYVPGSSSLRRGGRSPYGVPIVSDTTCPRHRRTYSYAAFAYTRCRTHSGPLSPSPPIEMAKSPTKDASRDLTFRQP